MTAHGYSSLKGPFVTGDSGKSASLHKKKVYVAKLKMIQETRTEIYPSPFDFFVKTLSYEMDMRLLNAILYCHIIPHFNLV